MLTTQLSCSEMLVSYRKLLIKSRGLIISSTMQHADYLIFSETIMYHAAGKSIPSAIPGLYLWIIELMIASI